MVKIELGKAYVDVYGLVICVHSYNPYAYGPTSDYRDHVYIAMCLSLDTNFKAFHSTFNTKGQFDRNPSMRDVVREATLEELESVLARHKGSLCTCDAEKIVARFHEEWKKHNPL